MENQYSFIKTVFEQTITLNREKYKDIEHLLDDDTKYFLFEFGIPDQYTVFEFIDSDFYNEEYNILCLGHNGKKFNGKIDSGGSYIGIDLNTNEVIMFYDFGKSGKCILAFSLKNFILIMFEFEMFYKTYGISDKNEPNERVNRRETRRFYMDYLGYRLLQIDSKFFEIYDNKYVTDPNYYWGSVLEEMENGIMFRWI
ncbi:MAG TPA: hypothetical protein VGE24_02505 [Emticicia sp.]